MFWGKYSCFEMKCCRVPWSFKWSHKELTEKITAWQQGLWNANMKALGNETGNTAFQERYLWRSPFFSLESMNTDYAGQFWPCTFYLRWDVLYVIEGMYSHACLCRSLMDMLLPFCNSLLYFLEAGYIIELEACYFNLSVQWTLETGCVSPMEEYKVIYSLGISAQVSNFSLVACRSCSLFHWIILPAPKRTF
jgi:hypothetical protein